MRQTDWFYDIHNRTWRRIVVVRLPEPINTTNRAAEDWSRAEADNAREWALYHSER